MAKKRVPSNWGLCFAGNEEAFCCALDVAATNAGPMPFAYAEIGLGYGGGMNAVGEYLQQFEGLQYRRVGVDLPGMTGNASILGNYFDAKTLELRLVGASAFFADALKRCEVYDFVFIDGCHGEACVMNDFLGAEKVVRRGGVVAFHDTDPGCQDIHPQPHCGTGIRARAAVKSLGLLHDTREGWIKLFETSGNKDKGGHGCLFVQRV